MNHLLAGVLFLFFVTTTAVPVAAQAAANPFGSGCTGSNGVPMVGATQGPSLGQPFTLNLTSLPLQPGFVWLMWSTNSDSWAGQMLPLDLAFIGAPGCMLNVRPDHNDFQLQAGPSLSLTYQVPATWSFLLGCRVLCQGLVCDFGVNAIGYTSTNGLELLFGP